jgi:DNA-binding Lrp family transcriptional regulator
VAILRVAKPDDLARVVTGQLARVPGIARTYTMVAFETYSRHDLEAMFSLGD